MLEEIAGTALNALRGELKRHAVRLAYPGRLPADWVDEVLMGQAMVNFLLENACRYTPPGSRIELGARHESKQVIIRVTDNGPGFPPGAESRVFEKFYRRRGDAGWSAQGSAWDSPFAVPSSKHTTVD